MLFYLQFVLNISDEYTYITLAIEFNKYKNVISYGFRLNTSTDNIEALTLNELLIHNLAIK